MHLLEENLRNRVNEIAQEDIYFKTAELMQKSEEITNAVICELVSCACCGQNVLPIEISRKWLKKFPKEWITKKIKIIALTVIDINDYWDYRRLLELADIISNDLLSWVISLSKNSNDIDIIDAVNDFRD